MIPYVETPVGGPTLLVAIAILTGHLWIVRIARLRALDTVLAAEMSFALIVAGLAGARLFRFAYLPDLIAQDPLMIFRRSAGIASFGGILGGLAVGVAWLRLRGQGTSTILRYLDVAACAFPRAWLFGRAACALGHDHPGRPTTSWLGVRFPDGARYDLGLLELFFTLALIPVVWILGRRNYPPGVLLGLLLGLYGAFRFLLDRLHVDPPQYFGWSVDQLASSATVAIGLTILLASRRRIRAA